MRCNFGDSYSACNIIFDDGLKFRSTSTNGMYWLTGSTNYNGSVIFRGNHEFNGCNFYSFFDGCESYDKPFNLNYYPNDDMFSSFAFFFTNAHKLSQPVYLNILHDGNVAPAYRDLNFCSSFKKCFDLRTVNVNANVTNIEKVNCSQMFYDCKDVNVNLSISIDSPYSIDFSEMFAHPQIGITNSSDINFNPRLNVTSIANISKFVSFYRMFHNCTRFNSSADWIQNFTNIFTNTDVTYDFRSMYSNCWNFNQSVNIVLDNVNTVLLSGMFYNCQNFDAPISISVSANKIDCYSMFFNCNNFNQSVEIHNNTINCASMFYKCNKFNKPITIPEGVTNCHYMFYNCRNFNQDVYVPDSVTNFRYIVEGSPYKSTISIPTINSQLESPQIGLHLGISPTINHVGATYIVRDSGKTATVISYINEQGKVDYKWSDTD